MLNPSQTHASPVRERVDAFCRRYGLDMPLLEAPMAGACPATLAIAVANAGGMGAFGALVTSPQGIRDWVKEFKANSNGSFQLNTWIPDPPPVRDAEAERRVREFLANWGPAVPPEAGDAKLHDFQERCDVFLDIAPPVVSTIMGLFPAEFVDKCKQRGIAWFACVTTLSEAMQARDAGADAIVVQGIEAGGHRGSFDAAAAERQGGTLFTLLPRIADKITDLPLIAFMLASTAEYAGPVQPEVWRRYLAMIIDGMRPARDGLSELPVAALTPQEMEQSIRAHSQRTSARR